MNREHRLSALEVRGRHRNLPVEATRAEQGRVEDVGPVGRGDQDDAALGLESVHLDQQLVQCLLALVVAATHAGPAVPTDGIDLVDEDDRRRVGLGLLEQIANSRSADADEHLDEVGAGDRVERHPGLAGNRPSQQRLAGSRWSVQQHALGDLRAQRLVPGRVLQEVLDLVEFFDRFVGTGDIGELGARHVLGEQLGFGLAEAHHLVPAGLRVVHHPHQETDDEHDRKQVDEPGEQRVVATDLGVVAVARAGLLYGGEDLVGGLRWVLGVDLRRIADRTDQQQPHTLFFVVDHRFGDVAVAELLQGDRRRLRGEPAGVVG